MGGREGGAKRGWLDAEGGGGSVGVGGGVEALHNGSLREAPSQGSS